MALSILQHVTDTRCLSNAVDINGKIKLNAVSNDTLKIQRVDGTTLNDSFELSLYTVDKSIISNINNVNILQAISNNTANVYSNYEVNNIISLFDNKDVSHLTYSKFYDVYNNTQIGSLMAHNEPLVITKAPKINKLYYNIM